MAKVEEGLLFGLAISTSCGENGDGGDGYVPSSSYVRMMSFFYRTFCRDNGIGI